MAEKKPEGLPAYGFESLLELCDLATVTMLRRDRRQPADNQKPVACYWTGHEYALLYRASGSKPMPALSPGRQARWDEARRCAGPGCGKTAKSPFARARDGKRYCEPCQEPAAERLWRTEQAARTAASAEWAREVMADERTVLVDTSVSDGDWRRRRVRIEDFAGRVLLDVRYPHVEPGRLTAAELAECTVTDLALLAGQLAEVFTGRRVVTWYARRLENAAAHLVRAGGAAPIWSLAAAGDDFGKRYANWVGSRAIHPASYRFNYEIRQQHSPPVADAAEVLERMRACLIEMAAEPVVSGG